MNTHLQEAETSELKVSRLEMAAARLAIVAFFFIIWCFVSYPILLLFVGSEFEQSTLGRFWVICFFVLPFWYIFHWGIFFQMETFLKWVARVLIIVVDILIVMALYAAMFGGSPPQ